MKKLFFLLLAVLLSLLMPAQAQDCQSRQIEGLVVDGKEEPIVGAVVALKNDASETIADFDGMFSLAVPRLQLADTLVVTYLNQVVSKPLADVAWEGCSGKLTVVMDIEDVDKSVPQIDIDFTLPVYLLGQTKEALLQAMIGLRRPAEHLDFFELSCYQNCDTCADKCKLSTHHSFYRAYREQAYGEACVGCVPVGNYWLFIRDSCTADKLIKTGTVHRFSYSIPDIGCYCAERYLTVDLPEQQPNNDSEKGSLPKHLYIENGRVFEADNY